MASKIVLTLTDKLATAHTQTVVGHLLMMRLAFTIFFFGLFGISYGQTISDIEKRLRLFDNQIVLKFDTTGLSTLPKFDYFCDDHFKAYDFPESKNKWDYYHVIDLNNDGLKDLIYSGPCLPYPQTGIFLSDGVSLTRVHDYAGKVISIENKPGRTIINIFKEFCCCDYFSDYKEVIIRNDSHFDKNQISFEGNTQIKFDKLREIKVKGVLRTSPELNDTEKKDDCSDQIIKGNHLAYIKKLTTVFQLNQSGQWRLILYPVDKFNSWIGWIKVDK
jgi:hypothetical protein